MSEMYKIYRIDFASRYFTEDIPFGTYAIQAYARKLGVATPTIDTLISDMLAL